MSTSKAEKNNILAKIHSQYGTSCEVIANWHFIFPYDLNQYIKPKYIENKTLFLSVNGPILEAYSYQRIIKDNINKYFCNTIVEEIIIQQ